MNERLDELQWRLDGARAEAEQDWVEEYVDYDIDEIDPDYPPESDPNDGIVPWR